MIIQYRKDFESYISKLPFSVRFKGYQGGALWSPVHNYKITLIIIFRFGHETCVEMFSYDIGFAKICISATKADARSSVSASIVLYFSLVESEVED